MKKISVISFSGGLDSTSLLLQLVNNNYKVFALSFNYGQKHLLELKKADKNIKYLNKHNFDIKHKILDISDAVSILDSSLTNKNDSIPNGYYKEENMKSTVVPNRNAIFTSFIYAFALTIYKKTNNKVDIALGVHAGDHDIYPDCREEFYYKIFDALKEGNWNSENINLFLPYLKLSKSEIIKNALDNCQKLKLDFNKIFKNTLTSYEPNEKGISNGKTASDIERILAFNKLGIKDPIKYNLPWEDVLKHALNIEKKFKNYL